MALWECRHPYEQTDARENITFLKHRLLAVLIANSVLTYFTSMDLLGRNTSSGRASGLALTQAVMLWNGSGTCFQTLMLA